MDFSAKGVKTPCVRTRAWLVRTRKSTRESWRGTTTDWRRRCSRSSTERSLSFTNLCCRSTLTGRTQHCVCVCEREIERMSSRVCMIIKYILDVKLNEPLFLLLENHAANGQLDKVVWVSEATCSHSVLCGVFVLFVHFPHCVEFLKNCLLELCSWKENLISECLLYRNTVHLIPLITSSPTVEEAKPPTQINQELISVYSFNYWKLWSHDAFVNPISVITHKKTQVLTCTPLLIFPLDISVVDVQSLKT